MRRVAKFEKVSFEQFYKDYVKVFEGVSLEEVQDVYDRIVLPKRATRGSCGYDFFMPYDLELKANEEALIPTGIRVRMDEEYVLLLYPRSSLGFKYRLQLNNTVGVIDADYYGAKNEGHVFARVLNDSRSDKVVSLKQGDGFMQGIFMMYGITVDDDVNDERIGGIGSTSRKSD